MFKAMFATLGGLRKSYNELYSNMDDATDRPGESSITNADSTQRAGCTVKQYMQKANVEMQTINESQRNTENSSLNFNTSSCCSQSRAPPFHDTIHKIRWG